MTTKLKAFQFVLSVVIVLGLLSPTLLLGGLHNLHAHPLLVQIGETTPEKVVAVIVQKADRSGHAEELARALGGVISKELSMINAFTASMAAHSALELSASPSVRWVSLDAPMTQSGSAVEAIDTTNLMNAFVRTVGADQVWNDPSAYLQGQGVTVAVIDSGDCTGCLDLKDLSHQPRTLAAVSLLTAKNGTAPTDLYGHGSLIEGILGNNGTGSGSKYLGIAPSVNLVSVKIANNLGEALTSDVVNGLQWVLNNKDRYNIRVVNLSLNSATAESYHTSPIDAAVEILWFNGIVVVVSAGNDGSAGLYPPANDPFVITVGATDDNNTAALSDDSLAPFSAYGMDESGGVKPDLVAPGTNIVSFVPRTKNKIFKDHASNRTGESTSNEYYMRVSGTSFSAPIVAGAAALLLQDEPNLTPDQVKYRLMATANKSWPGYDPTKAGAGCLDVYAAVHGASSESANLGITASHLLWTGTEPVTWGSVAWNSVAWNSVAWNSVAWNSVAWNSVAWNSDYWEP